MSILSIGAVGAGTMIHQGFNDPEYRPAPLLREMVDAGCLGRKSGRGFYSHA